MSKVVSNTDGRILWDVLAEGKTKRSATYNMRKCWRDHLKLESDDELRVVLQPLRIVTGFSLRQLGFTLNDKLTIAGFQPVEAGVLIHPYDELTRKLLERGQTKFTAPEIERICKEEHVFRGRFVIEPDVYRVGIRSFLRAAENLADETDSMLLLLVYFNGRQIKASHLWQEEIYPQIRDFLSQVLKGRRLCHLHLHAHSSIAFASGYCLDSKLGVAASPVQYVAGRREVWTPVLECDPNTYPKLTLLDTDFMLRNGSDVAIALGITHDIRKDVETYVAEHLEDVRRIAAYSLPGGHGGAVVHDGTHARLLAEQLSGELKSKRTAAERKGTLHLFAAAPNGLMFFIGQLARSFGHCILYEYNLEGNQLGAYQPSLAFPPADYE